MLSLQEVMEALRTFKRTALLPVKEGCPVGTMYARTFICYKDVCDLSTKVYITKVIQKVDSASRPQAPKPKPLPAAAGGGGGKAWNPFDDE